MLITKQEAAAGFLGGFLFAYAVSVESSLAATRLIIGNRRRFTCRFHFRNGPLSSTATGTKIARIRQVDQAESVLLIAPIDVDANGRMLFQVHVQLAFA